MLHDDFFGQRLSLVYTGSWQCEFSQNKSARFLLCHLTDRHQLLCESLCMSNSVNQPLRTHSTSTVAPPPDPSRTFFCHHIPYYGITTAINKPSFHLLEVVIRALLWHDSYKTKLFMVLSNNTIRYLCAFKLVQTDIWTYCQMRETGNELSNKWQPFVILIQVAPGKWFLKSCDIYCEAHFHL